MMRKMMRTTPPSINVVTRLQQKIVRSDHNISVNGRERVCKRATGNQVIRLLAVTIGALLLLGCTGNGEPLPGGNFPGGDPERGRQALKAYGCGACHTIPGVTGAHATVGPSLERWAMRHNIAGNVPNTPDNMIEWLQHPQALEPGSLMPNLDVTEQAARDMGAYLYTLE